MSREKISVVGADYRTRYPRLYALADEGRRRFEIQLSRRGVEKEAPDDIFPRRDNLKALKRSRKVLSLSFPPHLCLVSFFYIVLLSKVDGNKGCPRVLRVANRSGIAVELQQNIRSSRQ